MNVRALVAEVDRLLKSAVEAEPLGAINWGDLAVVDVEARISLLERDATPYYVVMIEEASPECGLPAWIMARLDRDRFPGVQVECAW